QSDGIDGNRRRLAVAERCVRQEARRATAAHIRDDHPVALRGQQRRDVEKTVNVVGPAMKENDDGAIAGAGLGVSDIEQAGIDLLQWCKRRIGARLYSAGACQSRLAW